MSVKVGEVFVDVGLKGSDKSVKAAISLREGLQDVYSSGLAAKAAIVGVVYGLERIMRGSMDRGVGLQQFASLTGLSTDRLQKFQYAMKQMGVSEQETAGALRGLQKVMFDIQATGQLPWGANFLGINEKNINDVNGTLERLHRFARETKNIPFANKVLSGFLPDNIIAAFRSFKGDIDSVRPPNFLTTAQIESLSRARFEWSKLADQIEAAFLKLNSAHGLRMIHDLTRLMDKMIPLTDRILTLVEKLKVFEAISKVMEHITSGVELQSTAIDVATGKNKKTAEQILNLIQKGTPFGIINKLVGDAMRPEFKDPEDIAERMRKYMTPKTSAPKKSDINIKMEQHNQINGVKGAEESTKEIDRQTRHAMNQMASLLEVS